MKTIKSNVLAEACTASARTQKKVVVCVQTDDEMQGTRYAVFVSRDQLVKIQPLLGDFLSFEVGKQDLGDL